MEILPLKPTPDPNDPRYGAHGLTREQWLAQIFGQAPGVILEPTDVRGTDEIVLRLHARVRTSWRKDAPTDVIAGLLQGKEPTTIPVPKTGSDLKIAVAQRLHRDPAALPVQTETGKGSGTVYHYYFEGWEAQIVGPSLTADWTTPEGIDLLDPVSYVVQLLGGPRGVSYR